jgi:hypothetical protein
MLRGDIRRSIGIRWLEVVVKSRSNGEKELTTEGAENTENTENTERKSSRTQAVRN